jgi:hypothetical protein
MLSVPGEIPALSWPSVSDLSLADCDAVLCGRDITTLPCNVLPLSASSSVNVEVVCFYRRPYYTVLHHVIRQTS